ncbi:MAG: hypothetical protein H8E37_12865 [Planctomycetes bacterium]|nr:hypothetical protein [Planctomycetota bacterium]
MFELKPLSREAIPAAMARVERYRLLNEPRSAASICRDVLQVEPDHHEAQIHLILSLTDQFPETMQVFQEARDAAAALGAEYDREYYSGIVCERRAYAQLGRGAPGSGCVVYEQLRDAMDAYDRAEKVRPPENDDAILRWNTCARVIMDHENIRPEEVATAPLQLE